MPKIELPKKSFEEIKKILEKRKWENLEAIQSIEKFFIKKRGYVFKMPKQKKPVILLLSGGLDSIISWALLMEIYQLTVYPLVRISPESGTDLKRTKKTIDFFSKLFLKKYPSLFRQPFFFQRDSVVKEIKKEQLKKLKKNKKALLKLITPEDNFMAELPDFMSQFVSPALQYKELLETKIRQKINTVFFGLISSDGEVVKAQTFTSLRSLMFHACNTTQNYYLQISSLALEKELGNFLSAKEMIQAAHQLNLPLEKTWSCQNPKFKYHCGTCFGCGNRQFRFSIAGVKDKTIYISSYGRNLPHFYYKRYFQPHFPLLHKLLKLSTIILGDRKEVKIN